MQGALKEDWYLPHSPVLALLGLGSLNTFSSAS